VRANGAVHASHNSGVTDRAIRGTCSAGSGIVRCTTSLGLRPSYDASHQLRVCVDRTTPGWASPFRYSRSIVWVGGTSPATSSGVARLPRTSTGTGRGRREYQKTRARQHERDRDQARTKSQTTTWKTETHERSHAYGQRSATRGNAGGGDIWKGDVIDAVRANQVLDQLVALRIVETHCLDGCIMHPRNVKHPT